MIGAYTTGQLKTLWTIEGTASGSSEPDPTVYNGTVYCYGEADYPYMRGLFALDAVTGAQKWVSPYAYQLAPQVYNGMIWAPDTRNRAAIMILDSQTGQQKGSFILPFKTITDTFVAGNTLFQRDTVRNLYALDPYRGVVKWQFINPSLGNAAPLYVDGNGNITRPGSSGEQN